MFKPIKNLITYIQKNASGSALFGGTTTPIAIDDVNNEKIHAESVIVNSIMDKGVKMEDIAASTLKDESKNVDEIVECKTTATMAEELPNAINNNNNNYDDEDDIELQIKSSIMIRKSSSVEENDIVAVDVLENGSDNDGTVDTADDLFSVDSTEPINEPELVEELTNTEDEGSFSETTRDVSTYPDILQREIIVLNDTDLNSSIASDALSEDPLAIDDFAPAVSTAATIAATVMEEEGSTTQETIIPIDSSTNDEVSRTDDVLWIDIDSIKKKNSPMPNVEKDLNAQTAKELNSTLSQSSSQAPQERHTPKKSTDDTTVATATKVSCRNSSREEHAEELRSDGSDSGLGSETSALHSTVTSITDTSQMTTDTSTNPTPSSTPTQQTSTHEILKEASSVINNHSEIASTAIQPVAAVAAPLTLRMPLRSNLKRRLEVVTDDDPDALSETTTSTVVAAKKPKRSINFDTVQVYYFPRQQGFGCVPSAGGCTLGMSSNHVACKTLTLTEHAAEIRRAHRLQLQEINPRGSSSDDSEESEEDYLSEGSGSDLDGESNGFLQPVSPKQRRALLKAAGVRKIDPSEKAECRNIRNSREVCGCTCRDFCDPDTCACSQAGIKCQVDRAMFPCGCSRDACGNSVGRVEFNPARVRTHFIHTIMRLEMENRQQQNPPLGVGVGNSSSISYSATSSLSASGINTTTTHSLASHVSLTSNYYGMQSQSNYSSGYASPAYTTDPAANYYQQQQHQQQQQHFGSGSGVINPDLLQTTQFPLDTLDAGLFANSVTGSSPSYGELIPSYGNVAGTATVSSTYHNLNYSAVTAGASGSGGGAIQTQVATYSAYHHQQVGTNYITPNQHTNTPTTYSSCAVPSIPPYGTATTTAVSAQYHSSASLALDTTAGSSCSISETVAICGVSGNAGGDGGGGSGGGGGAGGTSFINLNTPIASSSRLSQINDLLQHNRNTTAALVAVSHCPNIGDCINSSSTSSGVTVTTAIDTDDIEEQTVNEAQSSCLPFDELSLSLGIKTSTTDSAALLENDDTCTKPSSQTEPPPSPPILDDVANMNSDDKNVTSVTTATTALSSLIELTTETPLCDIKVDTT